MPSIFILEDWTFIRREWLDIYPLHLGKSHLNFHRPCLFPEEIVDARGKRKKRYPYANLMTPYEKFKSLPAAGQYLKPDITFKKLDDIAMQDSDNEAARHLNKARERLFREINKSRKPAA